MQSIFKYIETIAEFNVPVLITGDTGAAVRKEIIFADSLPTFEEMKKIYTNEAMKRTNHNQISFNNLSQNFSQ